MEEIPYQKHLRLLSVGFVHVNVAGLASKTFFVHHGMDTPFNFSQIPHYLQQNCMFVVLVASLKMPQRHLTQKVRQHRTIVYISSGRKPVQQHPPVFILQ